jgi:AMP nucleosidase
MGAGAAHRRGPAGAAGGHRAGHRAGGPPDEDPDAHRHRDELFGQLNQSRAIAVDMESATVAANGLRFRVPYGTLLCVSDKPLHGELKLGGMANNFYRERVSQHLSVGLETMRILRDRGVDRLHSRKLRGFDEPAFR